MSLLNCVRILPILALMFRAGAAEPLVQSADLPRIPPTAPEKAISTFDLRPGFRAELMAAEPLIVDPVAMSFDEDGRLYVIEMRDYSERRDEKLGRVKLLEDTDGDGRFDEAHIFAEGLPWPTGITCWDGGVFVIASPDLLYLKDMDGDGKAEVRAMIFTGFGNLAPKLNVQALPNSLQWGPDQRIHGALGGNPSLVQNFARFGSPKIELRGRDFSFDPRQMDLRAESGGGQFGMTFDKVGRKYVCSNSRHLVQVMFEDRIAARVRSYPLPSPAIDIAADGPQAEVFRRSPDEPWRVLRTEWRKSGAVKGIVEGGGRPSGYFTSATGVTIYRGDAFPPEYQGNAFIADCGSNLIHRKVLNGSLVQNGTRGEGEERREFLASSDNWFRPVAFANAPDGLLWFADIHREVIEHPWSLPESLKQHLDLNAGNERGRIYRLVPERFTARPAPQLGRASTQELVALLAHSNGWHRDTAARLLHQRQDAAAVDLLEQLSRTAARGPARLLALQVLHGMEKLTSDCVTTAFHDQDEDVRAGAVRLAALTQPGTERLGAFATDPSPRVRAEVAWAFAASDKPPAPEVSADLLEHADSPWLRHAALAAAGADLAQVLPRVAAKNPTTAVELQRLLGGNANPAAIPVLPAAGPRKDAIEQYRAALTVKGDAAKGQTIFETRCAMCHRVGGRGHLVGPDLDASAAAGREKLMENILDPSREITEGFPLAIAETQQGESIAGLLANETAAGVVLRLPGGAERVIRSADLAKLHRSEKSLMPDGLEGGLTTQDFGDLLEFLSTPPATAAPAPR